MAKGRKIYSTIAVAFMAVATMVALIMATMVTNITTVAITLTGIVLLSILLIFFAKKKDIPLFVCSIVFPICLICTALFWGCFFHFSATSTHAYQYRAVKAYTYGQRGAPDFFPDEIPDSAKDYRFEFLPSFLQGHGHVSLEFTADDDYIEELVDELEKTSEHSFKLSESGAFNDMIHNEDPDDYFKGFEMYWGSTQKLHPDATVYVIKSNYNTHFPHTHAVVVDGNYVFFSDY